MKLIKARVTNFRSVEDSEEFEIGDMTCLVGKNEAGKTALLHALRGLHPTDNFCYDRTRDYPRRHLAKFNDRHPSGESKVINTWWALNDNDVAAIEKTIGPDTVSNREIQISRSIGDNESTWIVNIDHEKVINHFVDKHKLDAAERSVLRSQTKTYDAVDVLTKLETRTAKQDSLLVDLKAMRKGCAVHAAIDVLAKRMPKFFYTSHFERMSGEVSLDQLASDRQNKNVKIGDQIFLDFLEYAGTTIEDLQATTKYEELVAQCEAASNDITDEIFEFWSQNEALAVKIEIGQGRKEDPPPFNAGNVAKIRIENRHHRVTVPLSERSAGFVWFFSFLSQFKQLKKTAGNAIILLDEPGLTLHGKAQSDLLRYIEERLLPDHQVIFSTHSPFMVPTSRLSDVRVVEDVVEHGDRGKTTVKGTKVSSDVLSVDQDTLFPLQAQLGYEITQSLFIGKNTLLVEGPSDVLYLQILSQALISRGRTGLDKRWTICPTGGLDKVTSFASLFRGNKLNIAVLCDYGSGDKGKVERLKQSQILQSGKIYTAADFTGKSESDIEDFIAPALYCDIVNKAYELDSKNLLSPASIQTAGSGVNQLVKQVEAAFRLLPANTPEFNHFTPSNWLLRNPQVLDSNSSGVEATLKTFEKVFETINPLIN